MTDLVLISLENWDQVWRRNQHLVAGLLDSSHVDRVLFVEPPVDPLHEVRQRRRPGLRSTGLRRIARPAGGGELWAFRPLKPLPRRLDEGGDRRRAAAVVRAARRLGLVRPTLWVNDPGGAEVLTLTGWPALYDITDDWLMADRPPAERARLTRQETQLLAECDEVVVCSPGLERAKSTGREVVLIPNAVDLDAYRARLPRPQDLPQPPVALYVGTAHRDRLDVELCVATARRLAASARRAGAPTGTVAVLGPHPLPARDLGALREAGVVLLGPRPASDVPAYLQNADVLLVPHVVSDFTMSLDPIKAYEYRAAGRPVVSTPVPGFVGTDDPAVVTAPAADFPAAVATAMDSAAPWRGAPAGVPSWSDRVEQVSQVLRRLEEGGA